jgi:ribulose-bisphosphate carboxylase large chain
VEVVRALYRLSVGEDRVAERAETLALEQTVELPRSSVRDPRIEREIVPRVGAIEADPRDGFRVEIRYPVETTALDPAQLLTVLLGNASLQEDVALLDVEPPPSLREALGGPRFGIDGLRRATGVEGRPLTCVALKPMGATAEDLAALCETFARAGIDVVKDDHGLADTPACPLEARVRACVEAVDRAADATGRRSLYAPNVVGPPAAVRRQLERARELGAGAVLAAPLVLGLPAFWELASTAGIPVLAHPALGGASRFSLGLLLGTILRLYGADAVVFPHAGGRFPFGHELCRELADRLRRPWQGVRAALPVPAGGMSVERVEEMVSFYGGDAMLLVGGTLYEAGAGLEARARIFVERVRDAAAKELGRTGP